MPTYLLRTTLDRFRNRLEEIQKEKLDVARELKEAASYGDLSENAEYDTAKHRKDMLAHEEIRLRDILREAQLIEELESPPNVVTIGKQVRLLDVDNQQEMTFAIVGEHDRPEGEGEFLSYTAPLATGLLQKKLGRTVEVKLPRETRYLKILDITPLFPR